MHCEFDLGDMTLTQGHDTPLGHGQQLRKNIQNQHGSKKFYPDTDFYYVLTVSLTLEIKIPFKNKTNHPISSDSHQQSWHTLRSWTTIV